MSKQQMIQAIREHNLSAEADVLMSFDESTLASYLERLNQVHNCRGARWVRLGDTTAVVTRHRPPVSAAA